MPRVLVVGGTGLLGQYLRREAARRGYLVWATARDERLPDEIGPWLQLDLLALDTIPEVVRRARAVAVFNAAAKTDAGACERERERALIVNAAAAARLAANALKRHAAFVHFSSADVFDGHRTVSEAAEPRATTVIGRTRRQGEQLVREANPWAVVLRTAASFGWNRLPDRPNPVTAILERLEAGEELRLDDRRAATPTYAATAASAAFDLWGAHEAGTFHVACADRATDLDRGRAIAAAFRVPNPRLLPAARAEARNDGRPRDPVLVTRKLEATLGRLLPRIRDCLDDMRATRPPAAPSGRPGGAGNALGTAKVFAEGRDIGRPEAIPR